MFALANGFDVPKFMEEDPDEMDDDVRHLMKQNKIASKHNKEQIQRIYVRLICVSFCEGTIKIELSQGDRFFILRLNLHQSLNFPLLYCMIRLVRKEFVHKFSKVNQILNILQWLP